MTAYIQINTKEAYPGNSEITNYTLTYNKSEYKLESGTTIQVYSEGESPFSTEDLVSWKELGSDKIKLKFPGMCERSLTNLLVRRKCKDVVGTGFYLWNLLLSEIEEQLKLDSILFSVAVKGSEIGKDYYLTKEESTFYHSLPSEILTLSVREFKMLKRIVIKLSNKMKLNSKELKLMNEISSCRSPTDMCCKIADVDDISLASDNLDDLFKKDGNKYHREFWTNYD